jgi:hypothetical protein
MRFLALAAVAALGPLSFASEDRLKWRLDLEGLATQMGRNDVGLPGGGGTRFPFRQLTGRGPFSTGRATLVFAPVERTEWRLMLQPFSFSGTGRLEQATNFEGAVFAAGPDTKGTYRFNSYRLTYRNLWKEGPRSRWMVGGTLKIRDAEIALEQGGLRRSKKDLGVVPLLHVYGEEQLGGRWLLVTDLDAAWAPQGRAVDLGVQLAWQQNERTRITGGLRLLEGGADNEKVYNFSLFSSITLGVQVRF